MGIEGVLNEGFVTTSVDIVPQFREFERFTTATISAFVGPKTGSYLERLASGLERQGVESELHVMMSSGGVAGEQAAAERPVTLLLSGPSPRLPLSGRTSALG